MPSTPPNRSDSLKRKATIFWKYLSPWLVRILPWVCILLPALFLAKLMRDHLVNIPFLDDFMFQPMLEKAHLGFRFTMAPDETHLTLHDFFLVQMEHRMAFVRAIIMLRHHFWPSDLRPENWLTYALLVGTLVNVGLLMKNTIRSSFGKWWPLLALASFAIFSPVQYQVVLWAMMFQVAVPAFALSSTLVALLSRRLPLWVKWSIGVVAALCATLSFASGILVWLLPLPAIIWGGGLPQGRRRWVYLGLWLAAFAVTMGLYFHDLHNEVDGRFAYKQEDVKTMDRNVGAVLKSPGKSLAFVLHFVGGTLGRGLPVSIMSLSYGMGLVSVLLLLALSFLWLAKLRDKELREQLIPWICFGFYSVGAGAMVAMGRVWATTTGENAISPRYTIHTVPLTIALTVMVGIVLQRRLQASPTTAGTVRSVRTALFTVLAMMLTASWLHGECFMQAWQSARLRMATSTMFFKEFRVTLEGLIAPNKRRARSMDDAGLFPFKMTESNLIEQFRRNERQLSDTTARWTKFTISTGNHACVAEGFACLRHRHREADAVFLTYKDRDGHWVIFTVAQVRAMPLFLSATLGRDLQNIHIPGDFVEGEALSGFRAEFPLDQLPKEKDLEVAAWAFDFHEKTVYPMAGRFRVNAIRGVVRPMDKNLAPLQKRDRKK